MTRGITKRTTCSRVEVTMRWTQRRTCHILRVRQPGKEEGRGRGGRQEEGGIEEEQKRGRCGAEEGVVLRTVPATPNRTAQTAHPNTDTHGGEIGRRYGL